MMQGEVTQRESTLQSPVCRVQLMYSLNGIDAHSPSYPNGLTVDTGFLPPPIPSIVNTLWHVDWRSHAGLVARFFHRARP
jgi:hypothetical protein